MSMAEAALRQEIEEAKGKVFAGLKPRDVFERVLFEEVKEQLGRKW